MTQALKVINFEQNNSGVNTNADEKTSPKSKVNSPLTKLLVLVNLIFALTILATFFYKIELLLLNSNVFFITAISVISFSTFLLGSIRNNEKSYELKVINKDDIANESSEIKLSDSIIPYFKLSSEGSFLCSNKSLTSLLNVDSLSSLNFFNDFVKKNKIKKHILLKLKNKGKLENYRLWLNNNENGKIYVNMSCKYSKDTNTLEGSLTDITSQHTKEKSIAEEIERLKTKILIAEENTTINNTKSFEATSKLVHDLKSPLNSIFGFLTLIENQHYETDEELIEFSHNAKIAGEKLLQTINDKFENEEPEQEIVEEKSQIFNEVLNPVEEENKESFLDFTVSDFDVQFGSGPNILLVEDNAMNQQVEIKLLEKVGYNVFAVESGEEAIEQVKTDKFDLVLMDIELLGMNGLEATKEIRSLSETYRDIPIIAATAKSSMKDREKCLEAGMNDYISKPINISFMKMTIDQWLKKEVA